MKVLTVVGARPQFVKSFAVSNELSNEHEEVLVHTGQHYDTELSDVFFEDLGLSEPDYHLGVGSGSHSSQTAKIMLELEPVIETESPDAVLVYGDTNSTLAGALVAAKQEPTLVHVEAGLRSYNRSMPEEVNRVITDHVSDLLLAPSNTAVNNLEVEGITERVHFTGDVMYDAVLWARERAPEVTDPVAEFGLETDEFVLATIHRAGNTDSRNRLAEILDAFVNLDQQVVFPAHPRTVERMEQFDLDSVIAEDVQIIDPVGYLDFVSLLDEAGTVVTDSGGVQKEAFFLDTPCVTVRPETEWVETVEAGWNTLVEASSTSIREAVHSLSLPEKKPTPYGGGNAAATVVSTLEDALR